MQRNHRTTRKLGKRCIGGILQPATHDVVHHILFKWRRFRQGLSQHLEHSLFSPDLKAYDIWACGTQSRIDTYIKLFNGLTSSTVYCLRFFYIFILVIDNISLWARQFGSRICIRPWFWTRKHRFYPMLDILSMCSVRGWIKIPFCCSCRVTKWTVSNPCVNAISSPARICCGSFFDTVQPTAYTYTYGTCRRACKSIINLDNCHQNSVNSCIYNNIFVYTYLTWSVS